MTHRRGNVGDPVQPVELPLVSPGENDHRNGGLTALDFASVGAHQLEIVLEGPVTSGLISAQPVLTKGPTAVLHPEVLPAVLLCRQGVKPVGNKGAKAGKFRGLLIEIRRQHLVEVP